MIVVVIGILAAMSFIYFNQDNMIYNPRPYRDDYKTILPDRAVKLEYKISCGRQTAWYVPPRSADDPHALPDRLWMLFGGNGSLALFWAETVNASPDADAGFILFDYPGYGFCEGNPSIPGIAESGDAVIAALAQYLGVPTDTLMKQKIRLMGHSLGTGMALAFANRHHVDRVVLVAPFTTFYAVADTVVSPWLSWLLSQNMDNLEALKKLAAQESPPRVIVTHGDRDNIVPVEMGRTMERKWPDLVDYIEVPGADHTNILGGVEAYMAPELPDPLKSLDEARSAARTEKRKLSATPGAM